MKCKKWTFFRDQQSCFKEFKFPFVTFNKMRREKKEPTPILIDQNNIFSIQKFDVEPHLASYNSWIFLHYAIKILSCNSQEFIPVSWFREELRWWSCSCLWWLCSACPPSSCQQLSHLLRCWRRGSDRRSFPSRCCDPKIPTFRQDHKFGLKLESSIEKWNLRNI